MTEAATIAALIGLGIDLALSIEALNDFLRRHRRLVDQVQQHRSDLWDELRTRTKARRHALPE